jgi:hypothetical protein
VTLIRLIRALPDSAVGQAPWVLGVDEFALRCGQIHFSGVGDNAGRLGIFRGREGLEALPRWRGRAYRGVAGDLRLCLAPARRWRLGA